ncbi:cellulose biosynthesis protein BcsS [Hyphomicrobium sp.]|uniref:cellulose biosynthesis protein BcsS n=1 Tax=Hyphomicrobium sp. TaxID=82 RepID=UPI002D1FAC14|nr:cellulose biosynthesis protein BcsS [Hyphomicrobium sp.]
MKTLCYRALLTAVAAGTVCISTSASSFEHRSSGPTSTVVFSGVDFAKDAFAAHAGAIKAVNGDLGKDGVMLRALGVYVDYEYDTDFGAGPLGIDGEAGIFDLMIGYQFLRTTHRLGIYAGVEFQGHELSPDDPFNEIDGNEWGFKIAADYETAANSPLYVGLIGSYSTAFDTYWTRARVGAPVGRFVLGVEGLAHGNNGYDAQRLGGFVNIPLGIHYGQLSLSSGYQWADEGGASGSGGSSGAYGSAGISFSF